MSKRVDTPKRLMDTAEATRAVSSLWVLVYSATYRQLSPEESEALRRLANLLAIPMTDLPSFNRGAKKAISGLKASGILEDQRDVARLDLVLQDLYDLRDCLSERGDRTAPPPSA